MTAFVLVLAGVAAGDGGQRMGAAREPVAVNLEAGNWHGTRRSEVWAAYHPCVWSNPARMLVVEGYGAFIAHAVAGESGAALVEMNGTTYRGTYRLRGRNLVLRVGWGRDRLLFTLQR